MFKSIVVGTMLLLIMAFTAITVTRGGIPHGVPAASATSATLDGHFVHRVRTGATKSTALAELFAEYKSAIVTTIGVTFLLCFTVGFWKHHQILTEREESEVTNVTAQRRLNSD